MKKYKISFDRYNEFNPSNIKSLIGVCGLYFIFLKNTEIPYPFRKSRLIYVGMSEKRTNSIGKRLLGHYEGSSGNEGLANYQKTERLHFTHLNFEMLKQIWPFRIEDLESYFILNFVNRYGVYPICNNKTGFEVLKKDMQYKIEIDWEYFEREDTKNE